MFPVCLAKHVLADAEKLSVRNNYQIMDWWLCLLMKKRCLTDGGRDLVSLHKSNPAATTFPSFCMESSNAMSCDLNSYPERA